MGGKSKKMGCWEDAGGGGDDEGVKEGETRIIR